jgi:hypothetical protein
MQGTMKERMKNAGDATTALGNVTASTVSYVINAPRAVVFAALIDPRNAPKWLGVAEEKIDTPKVGIGTKYSERLIKGGPWEAEYEVGIYAENSFIEFKKKGTYRRDNFSLTDIGGGMTLVTYTEYNPSGIPEPFTDALLKGLESMVKGLQASQTLRTGGKPPA